MPWGMDPESFKLVFRKFVAAFEAAASTRRRSAGSSRPTGGRAHRSGRPTTTRASDVVDVVGFSSYNFGSALRSWVDPWQVVGAALDDLHSFAPDKPYFIAQVASADSGGDRDRWVRELFHLAEEDPHVAGLVYFNLNRETDWRIFDGLAATPGWVDSMTRPTTRYEWPLTGWFQPGPLPFVAPEPQPAPRSARRHPRTRPRASSTSRDGRGTDSRSTGPPPRGSPQGTPTAPSGPTTR